MKSNVKEKKDLLSRLNDMDALEVYKLVLSGELEHLPKSFYTSKDACRNYIRCFKYLIETKGIDKKILPVVLNKKFLIDYRLNAGIIALYNGDIFRLVNEIYPNEYSKSDFKLN